MKNHVEFFDNRSRRKGIYSNEQFKFLKCIINWFPHFWNCNYSIENLQHSLLSYNAQHYAILSNVFFGGLKETHMTNKR